MVSCAKGHLHTCTPMIAMLPRLLKEAWSADLRGITSALQARRLRHSRMAACVANVAVASVLSVSTVERRRVSLLSLPGFLPCLPLFSAPTWLKWAVCYLEHGGRPFGLRWFPASPSECTQIQNGAILCGVARRFLSHCSRGVVIVVASPYPGC